MKYLIAIGICIFCLFNQNGTEKVYLKPTNDQITLSQLHDAGQTMVDRLKLIDIEASFEIDAPNNSIAINSKSNLRDTRVKRLFTRSGHLAFMEGRQRYQFMKMADPQDPLFALIDTTIWLLPDLPRIQKEVVGTFTNESLEKVLVEIERLNHDVLVKNTSLHYVLGDNGEDARIILLASPEENGKVLRENINRVSVENSVGGEPVIEIELSEKGRENFATLTRNNLRQIIAIVLDNEILLAPRVNDEVTGGKISITGKFSKDQTKYYHAILQGPELPCGFEFVK